MPTCPAEIDLPDRKFNAGSTAINWQNCKWQMANGKWQMANGKWQMANGKWQMKRATMD
jgi:hypothetical protein